MMHLRAMLLPMLLAACADFTLVGLPANAESSFSIFLNVNHGDTLFTGMSAHLFPGSDAHGNPLPLADSTMEMQGEILQPRPGYQAVSYDWVAAFDDASGAPDSVRMRPPVIADDAAEPQTMTFLLPRRRQPYRLDHVAGSDLVVDVSSSAVTSPVDRINARWSVDITAEQRPVFSINSSGPLPSQVRLPWAWFGESVTAGDSLSLSVTRFEFYDLADAAYPTTLAVFARFAWNVRIVAGGSSSVR